MLETIALPGNGRITTRLGFGGSGLMGGLSERESLALLETAFETGIRHFDVAPSYGHGQAEKCLGKFLRGKRDQVTVATKYGILPPARAGLLEVTRRAVRPAVRRMPSVRNRMAAAAGGLKSKAKFSAEEARKSLEDSLRALGRDHIDLWLLHEVTAKDLDNSDLLPFLQEVQQCGLIGTYGVGGDQSHLAAMWERRRAYCNVLQFGWSVLERNMEFPGAFVIHYRAIAEVVAIRKMFARHPALCRRWSDKVGVDLAEPQALIATVLAAALSSNPRGIVLFSSRVPEHIRANVQAAEDPDTRAKGRRFFELVAGSHDDADLPEKN
ncbi:MAG TPA: aldo/keto reductase [Acidobacteriaceae bacterium]|nr:aldo/keto reductase [Acidobacteriaceae bacterium]